MEIFQQANFSDSFPTKRNLWTFFKKAIFCGNFLTKQIVVEIFPQIDFFCKLLHKWILCGNFQTTQFLVEPFPQFDLCGFFFF